MTVFRKTKWLSGRVAGWWNVQTVVAEPPMEDTVYYVLGLIDPAYIPAAQSPVPNTLPQPPFPLPPATLSLSLFRTILFKPQFPPSPSVCIRALPLEEIKLGTNTRESINLEGGGRRDIQFRFLQHQQPNQFQLLIHSPFFFF